MKYTRKILYGILFFVALMTSFIFGHLWKDLPELKFNNEVKIFDVLNWLLTLSIGVMIPLLVKKWIEDNRSIKICLVDEIKNILQILDKIKQKISDCHLGGSFSQDNREEINFLFHETELKMSSFNEQLQISFEPQSKRIMDQLKEKYYNYKDYLTGGEMMNSSFTSVNDRFFRENNIEYSKIETHIKTIVHKIHKL